MRAKVIARIEKSDCLINPGICLSNNDYRVYQDQNYNFFVTHEYLDSQNGFFKMIDIEEYEYDQLADKTQNLNKGNARIAEIISAFLKERVKPIEPSRQFVLFNDDGEEINRTVPLENFSRDQILVMREHLNELLSDTEYSCHIEIDDPDLDYTYFEENK